MKAIKNLLLAKTVRECTKCKESKFSEVLFDGSNPWSIAEQIKFHKEHDCAFFDFRPVHYLWFRPIKLDGLIPTIPTLPEKIKKEINNVLMVYTGMSGDSRNKNDNEDQASAGIMRPLAHLIRLKTHYDLSVKGEDHDECYAEIYKLAIKSKKNGKLGLMFIRNSNDINLVASSEYNSIQKFRNLGQPYFSNSNNGSNRAKLDDGELYEMEKENYRRIQYKLEKNHYILFDEVAIDKLDKIWHSNLKSRKGGTNSSISKTQFENILKLLYEMNPLFFVDQEQPESEQPESFFRNQPESIFERGEDASVMFRRTLSYIENYRRLDNYDPDMGQTLSNIGLHPNQLRLKEQNRNQDQ